jgi:hypothetical protein
MTDYLKEQTTIGSQNPEGCRDVAAPTQMKARLNQANALTSAALNQARAPAFKGARPLT